jgi:cobalt-zinc-cadmium efflux system outer membrane protein
MTSSRRVFLAALLGAAPGFGCVSPPPVEATRQASIPAYRLPRREQPPTGVIPAAAVLPAGKTPTSSQPHSLDALTQLALAGHPRLAQAGFTVEAARGRAIQAGLYPNPTVSVTGDELGDVQGPSGIWTVPYASQEIVTGGKLKLSRAAADRETDQAAVQLAVQRYVLLAAVRQAYFDALASQRRVEVLSEVLDLVEKAVEQTAGVVKAQQAARLILIQLQTEAGRVRAERDAAKRELPATYQRLAAVVGAPSLSITRVEGTLEGPLPEYDVTAAQRFVLATHPEVKAALAGVERARLLLRRAEAEPIPNVTVGVGYMRQGQNRSNDWTLGASMPVPVWNRNQGNIRAAKAQVGEAVKEVERIQADLADRLAASVRTYEAARERAEKYRSGVLPFAKEAQEISLAAFKGGQFESLQVLQAQRALAEANAEYVRTLGEAWRAAGAISGLLLEEEWPGGPRPSAAEPERGQR